MTSAELYQQYRQQMQKVADIKYASALLQWDQETYLPQKAAAVRGQQIATLSELSHQLFTDEKLGRLLMELKQRDDLSDDQQRNITLTLEDYNKHKKYTSEFVRRLTEKINQSFHAWIEARKQQSFAVFEKDLDDLIEMKKQEAEILGYALHPYDALLDEFEKGCTVSLLDKTFANILPFLKELLDKILKQPQVDDSFLKQYFPKQQQWDWGMYLVRQLNFDFSAGRQDISEHPFTINFASTDVRITTRVDENDFGNMTWSCIHETGHGLYEQGLPETEYGLPLGEAASLSIHESQSRLWENNVGRSQSFWDYYFPKLQQFFPDQFGNITTEQFYKGINKVAPSLIRTEADELTYHFHVFIRYELEKKLLEGTMRAKDIPSFWNEQYKKYLGVDIPNDKMGCLQDVHWSHGSFGYFPTYSLGSFYAAQFYFQLVTESGKPQELLKDGSSSSILEWLRENIHRHGRKFTSEELCRKVTGKPLDTGFFRNYLLHKYSNIYTL